MEKKRPVAVTVISWILIVTGIISITSSLLMLGNEQVKELMEKSPIPINVQYAMMFVGLAIAITCGICMLKGMNWARILYAVWGVIGTGVGFATSPMKLTLIPGTIFLIVIIVFLFLPNANEYFKPKDDEIPDPEEEGSQDPEVINEESA